MGTSGIQKGLVKNTTGNIRNYQNGVIVELKHYFASFTAYIDETCLGRNTSNPKTTIEKVKWFLIREHVWHNFKALYPKLTHQEFFERLKQEYSDFRIIEGNNSIITSEMITKGSEDGELGAIYLLMPYSVYPEYEGVANIRTVVLGEPRILYCHFKFPKEGYIPLENSDKKAAYGQTVDVEIYTHLLPDWRNNAEKFDFEVELINKGKTVAKSKLIEIRNLGNFSYNGRSKIQFLIEPEWQKDHQDKKGNEEYYLKLEGKLGSSHIAKVSQDNAPNNIKYESQNAEVDWTRMEKGKWIYDTSRMLLVPYDTLTDMMSKFEIEKTNMIQYIGDIRYTQKEYDPCGYSKITIKDEDDKERDSLIIFDEDDTSNPIDRTAKVFGIIAGDERKNISITLDKLTTKGVFCQGLLLEEGQKHSEQKNVFQLDRVMPALRRKDGVYIVEQDPTDKNDLDVTPDEKRGLSKDVSDVQQWQFGTDYKFDGENKMLIMPRYVYNKTALENVQVYSSSSIGNEALNSLWLFNYFVLDDDLTQTYFVPISTCRYPNQIAKIEVYPDIEWELAALIAVPLWKKTTFKFQSTREDLRSFHGRYGFRHITREMSVEAETEGKVGADFTLKASSSGKDYEAGYKIEKSIKQVIATFNQVSEEIEIFDGRDNVNMRQSAALKKGALKKIEFSIDPPNVAIALKWKHEIAKLEKNTGKIGWRIEGGIALKPFVGFGITVDLVPIVGKFGWVGKAVELIIEALEYTVKGLDIYFNFILTAEIASSLSIGYHNLDGWDKNAKREVTITVNASLEAGVNYEGTELISTIVQDGITYETQEELKIKASLGAGIEYKEEWDSDDKGIFKNVTVTFLGAEAKLEIYSSITRRKKTVYNDDEIVSNKKGDIKHNDVHKLLEQKTWYGPKKIYTDDEKDNK